MEIKRVENSPELFFKGNFSRTAGLMAEFELLVREHIPDPSTQRGILDAAALSRRLHFPQEDRLEYGGDSYINHPLEVAIRIVKQFKIYDDTIIKAALLHDSVEDQAGLLATLVPTAPREGNLNALALEAIERYHGVEVANLVAALSNPNFDDVIDRLKITDESARRIKKHELYFEHIRQLFGCEPLASVIKMSDLMQNALNLDAMDPGPKKEKLKTKYKPVLEYLVDTLPNISSSHLLYQARDEIVSEIEIALMNQYR